MIEQRAAKLNLFDDIRNVGIGDSHGKYVIAPQKSGGPIKSSIVRQAYQS